RLPNGNTLIADTNNNRVIEVTPEGEIAFSSDDWGGGSGRLSDGTHLAYPNDAHLLDDGTLLITDRNNDRCVIASRDGVALWAYAHKVSHPHNADPLPDGNVLMADSDGRTILEVNRAGRVVWSYGDGTPETLCWPRDADRLGNGNTLITDSKNNRVIEVTPGGQVVWEYAVDHFANFYEADKLPDGNVLISDQQHKQVLEVDPTGAVVWQWHNYSMERPVNARLVNGAFRDRDLDGLPSGWILATRLAEGGGEVIWDEGCSPRPCPGIAYDRLGAVYLQQYVEAAPGQRYTCTGQLRVAGLVEGVAYLQIAFVDAWGGYVGDVLTQPKGHPFSGDSDWAQDTFEAVAPPQTVCAEVRICITGPGKLWARGLMLFT
ncbi:MAG: PQQ-binding-like beta-propeller repeat protein, partial [Chloroflexi bacterium]|nr:PQQ-binding-like beta-propeller repeat protein [Chloroflexota bacterium]